MNHLSQVFNYGSSEVRTMVQGNEVWFLARDVCDVLEIKNSRDAISRLDEDEKDVALTDTLGGQQEMTIINEPGLYSLILGSRKKEAKQFKRWITHEVIPSIRKHGMYAKDELLDNPDLLIEVASKLKEERAARIALEKHKKENAHKVLYAEAVSVSNDSVLVKDLASTLRQKGLNIGPVRLFGWLRENGYLCKKKGEMWNMPTQKSLDLEVMVVKHGLRSGSDGEMKKTRTPKVTGKGQIYFINKLLGEIKEA
ncbi:phage antirepressor KilAC domain-containing protein [Alkalihalophilus marmarensis]|uniref:phage antirepressor n=1 Tax=Alkalihalophilus marmarensis TaxID=521377 RepID=UPI00203AE1D9|nr:phage antirepressor KilAC domain-containing protein [Alkalihalophilus marmarensis]MCM3488815.1 phage antirepressor KilAC domain-containing protein [Alkalihalophilus marmarensis]